MAEHGGRWFPRPLFWPGKPAWGAVEGGARVQVLNLVVDLGDGVLGDGNVVHDDLSHLDLFLEAGG